eukprot:767500-Hanusia_phi.AAC.1
MSSSPSPRSVCAFGCLAFLMGFYWKILAYENAFLKPFDELGGICLENTASDYHLPSSLCCFSAPHSPWAQGEGRQRVKGGGKSVAKWCGLALRNFLRAHLLVAAEHLERVEAEGDMAAREAKTSGKASHAHRPNKAVSPDDEEQVAKACILLER